MVAKSTMYVKFSHALPKCLGLSVLLLGVLLSLNSFAQTQTISTNTDQSSLQKKLKLNIRAQLGDKGFGNENGERSQQVGLLLGANSSYNFQPNFYLTADMNLYSASNQVVSRFGDNLNASGLYTVEALINWKPLDFLALRAGAVNQRYLQSPLLLSYTSTFPGVKETLEFAFNKNILSFNAEQTIPTSTMLSTKTTDRETSPSFYSETVNFKSKMIKSLELEIFGGLYQFADLPSQVALESSVYGNSTPQFTGPLNAQFTYDFSGWMGGANAKIIFPQIMNLNFGAQIMENMEAPIAYNQGQLVYLGAELLFSKNFSLEPRLETFFNESDTAPAFYNSSEYGHNNRQGWGAEVLLNFKNPDFAIRSKYVQADPIDFNVNQTKQQYFSIRLETSYDVL